LDNEHALDWHNRVRPASRISAWIYPEQSQTLGKLRRFTIVARAGDDACHGIDPTSATQLFSVVGCRYSDDQSGHHHLGNLGDGWLCHCPLECPLTQVAA
jgi:hypothetical protein